MEKHSKTKVNKLKFRQSALNALHSPENLDKLIQVITPRAWLILLAIYILLISILLWGIFGSIPTRVEGKGLLLVENGSVYNAVAPPGGGLITSIDIKPGQVIEKGSIVARLERPDLAEKLQNSISFLEKLKNEQKELEKKSESEIKSREEYIKQQKEFIENKLQVEGNNLKDIEKVLTLKESFFKKGYVVWQEIENTRRDLYATKDKIQQAKIQLVQLNTQEDDFKEQWRQKLKEKEHNILNEELKVHNLEVELQVSKTVLSPTQGIVISINASLGTIVNNGDSIASITSLGEGLDAIVFMLPKEGQKVTPGMPALIAPADIQREEYGSMKGSVLSVSNFPEAAETIIALLHNQELTKQFIESGAPTSIRLRIERDPNTLSGYRWTSSKGPQEKIMPGTLADVRITVRKQPPISLIIPAFKKLLGIE